MANVGPIVNFMLLTIFFVEKEARLKAETDRINKERKEQKKAEKEKKKKRI